MTSIGLSPQLEAVSGIVVGGAPVPDRPPVDRGIEPLAALEAAVLSALLRPPCLVTFSGGVDSSLVLAVATRVARRHGLPDPVPVTWRIPDAPLAEESVWQERVVDALDLREWVVETAGDDLDLVGPAAQEVLLRHGVRHPVNLHLHLRPFELATGGSVLTGVGGDQILSGWRRPAHHTRGRRLKNAVPGGVRARLHRLRGPVLPWLRPVYAQRVWAAHLDQLAAEPMQLGPRVRWHAGRRALTLTLDNLQRLAEVYDVAVVNPLVAPGFVDSLAAGHGDRPAPTRAELVASIGGDVLPSVIWQRRSKARFLEVFFRAPTREVVRTWDGTGVDEDLVDVAALRRSWSTWPVPPGTAGLVQQVFLAGTPSPVAPRSSTLRSAA